MLHILENRKEDDNQQSWFKDELSSSGRKELTRGREVRVLVTPDGPHLSPSGQTISHTPPKFKVWSNVSRYRGYWEVVYRQPH